MYAIRSYYEDHADEGYRLFMLRDGRFVGCLLIGKIKLMKAVRKASYNFV